MTPVQKILACLLFATLLTSCGGSLVYNRLDWLIPWYVDSYVDLSREQRQTLRDQLAPMLQQHRQEELVRYLQLLDEIETALQSSVQQAEVEIWMEKLQHSAERIEQSMLQVAVEFGASISDAQMAEFVDSLYSEQNELEEELLARTDEQYAREHAAHLEDLLERIIGRLDRNQKQHLQQAAGAMQRYDTVWLQDRQLWLDQLKRLLQRDSGWQAQLLQAYQDRGKARSENYREIVQHNKQVVAAAIAEVLNSRNSKQISHTRQEFDDLRTMLQKLGEQQPD
ncbi:MAG TPA: DUF6279 family lipoprotein, partial [Xanthomonadales bacterium]|nr:DUF6279 family lipoprotein [Xanthomonadales bacterium]